MPKQYGETVVQSKDYNLVEKCINAELQKLSSIEQDDSIKFCPIQECKKAVSG